MIRKEKGDRFKESFRRNANVQLKIILHHERKMRNNFVQFMTYCNYLLYIARENNSVSTNGEKFRATRACQENYLKIYHMFIFSSAPFERRISFF